MPFSLSLALLCSSRSFLKSLCHASISYVYLFSPFHLSTYFKLSDLIANVVFVFLLYTITNAYLFPQFYILYLQSLSPLLYIYVSPCLVKWHLSPNVTLSSLLPAVFSPELGLVPNILTQKHDQSINLK